MQVDTTLVVNGFLHTPMGYDISKFTSLEFPTIFYEAEISYDALLSYRWLTHFDIDIKSRLHGLQFNSGLRCYFIPGVDDFQSGKPVSPKVHTVGSTQSENLGSTVEIPSVIPSVILSVIPSVTLTCPVAHVSKTKGYKRYRVKVTPHIIKEDEEEGFKVFKELMFPKYFCT